MTRMSPSPHLKYLFEGAGRRQDTELSPYILDTAYHVASEKEKELDVKHPINPQRNSFEGDIYICYALGFPPQKLSPLAILPGQQRLEAAWFPAQDCLSISKGDARSMARSASRRKVYFFAYFVRVQ
jgi:hypothetical protein